MITTHTNFRNFHTKNFSNFQTREREPQPEPELRCRRRRRRCCCHTHVCYVCVVASNSSNANWVESRESRVSFRLRIIEEEAGGDVDVGMATIKSEEELVARCSLLVECFQKGNEIRKNPHRIKPTLSPSSLVGGSTIFVINDQPQSTPHTHTLAPSTELTNQPLLHTLHFHFPLISEIRFYFYTKYINLASLSDSRGGLATLLGVGVERVWDISSHSHIKRYICRRMCCCHMSEMLIIINNNK